MTFKIVQNKEGWLKLNPKHSELCLSATLVSIKPQQKLVLKNETFSPFCQKCQVNEITQLHLFGGSPILSKFWVEVRSAIATMMKYEIPLCPTLLFIAHKGLHQINIESSRNFTVSGQKSNILQLESKAAPDLIDRD